MTTNQKYTEQKKKKFCPCLAARVLQTTEQFLSPASYYTALHHSVANLAISFSDLLATRRKQHKKKKNPKTLKVNQRTKAVEYTHTHTQKSKCQD